MHCTKCNIYDLCHKCATVPGDNASNPIVLSSSVSSPLVTVTFEKIGPNMFKLLGKKSTSAIIMQCF